MRLLKFLSNRITIVTLAILSQIGVLIAASYWFEDMGTAINTVLRMLSFLVVCLVINEHSDVSIKLTWIVFILVTPVFGSMMYLLTGGKRPRKRMTDALSTAEKNNKKYRIQNKNAENALMKKSEELYAQSKYLSRLDFKLLSAKNAQYFSSGEEAFPIMLEKMEKAEKFIFLEYFIFEKGEMLEKIIDVLERKAKKGVDIRLIYDDMGSLFTLPAGFREQLEQKGIKCIAFNPFVPFLSGVMNNRNHRKILVIDSLVAFTGGINIADEYINVKEKYGYWKDNAFMLEGEVVQAYTLMFLDMWKAFRNKDEDTAKFLLENDNTQCDGWVQPFCDTPLDDDTVGVDVYLNAINGAKKYIYIFTPYLIPGQDITGALCLAAKRGVDVRIMVPGIPDKKTVYVLTKSHYGPLISAGVRIYEYTPGFLHSKGFVSDDRIACGGTINLDFRSLHHHFECGCLFYNMDVVMDMKSDMLRTMEKSERICDYKKRRGIINAILRLIAPLM